MPHLKKIPKGDYQILWMFVSKFEDISSKHYQDIVFTRMDGHKVTVTLSSDLWPPKTRISSLLGSSVRLCQIWRNSQQVFLIRMGWTNEHMDSHKDWWWIRKQGRTKKYWGKGISCATAPITTDFSLSLCPSVLNKARLPWLGGERKKTAEIMKNGCWRCGWILGPVGGHCKQLGAVLTW